MTGSFAVFARIVWAGLLDRTRQPGYFVSLLVMIWVGQQMLPGLDASYRTFSIDLDHRPEYNAAWVGTVTALLSGLWFLFIGFYLVKGGVERDRRSGVGAVLAATRMRTSTYLWARTLTNAAVFASQALVVAAAAMIQQWLAGENRQLDAVATLMPFVLFTAPVALFVAAWAVFFDCVPGLRGGLGNIAWFFLVCFIMGSSSMSEQRNQSGHDLLGAHAIVQQVRPIMAKAYPEAAKRDQQLSLGVTFSPRYKEHRLTTFPMPGLRWTPELLAMRLPIVIMAALIVFAAAIPFDRFEGSSRAPRASEPRAWPFARTTAAPLRRREVSAHALTVAPIGFHPWGVVRAELALLLRGVSPWWWFVALGFGIAQCFVPLGVLRSAILPIASFWPALLWSQLGHRESANATHDVMFSCPQPVRRLLPAAWLAGALLMLIVGAPGLMRLLSAGESAAAGGWLLAAAMVPAWALACGAWSGGAKLFEVLYLFVWYIGPMHQVAPLDYTGVTASRSPFLWSVHAGVTAVGLLLAWTGRQRQMAR